MPDGLWKDGVNTGIPSNGNGEVHPLYTPEGWSPTQQEFADAFTTPPPMVGDPSRPQFELKAPVSDSIYIMDKLPAYNGLIDTLLMKMGHIWPNRQSGDRYADLALVDPTDPSRFISICSGTIGTIGSGFTRPTVRLRDPSQTLDHGQTSGLQPLQSNDLDFSEVVFRNQLRQISNGATFSLIGYMKRNGVRSTGVIIAEDVSYTRSLSGFDFSPFADLTGWLPAINIRTSDLAFTTRQIITNMRLL